MDLIVFVGVVWINVNVFKVIVVIDGKMVGRIFFDKDVLVGKYIFVVKVDGYKVYSQIVEVEVGKSFMINVEFVQIWVAESVVAEGGVHITWWFWMIIGVVVVGGGAIVGVLLSQELVKELFIFDKVWFFF